MGLSLKAMWRAQQMKPTGQEESIENHTTYDIAEAEHTNAPIKSRNDLFKLTVACGYITKRLSLQAKYQAQQMKITEEIQIHRKSGSKYGTGRSWTRMQVPKHEFNKLYGIDRSETQMQVRGINDAVSHFYTVCEWSDSTICRDYEIGMSPPRTSR